MQGSVHLFLQPIRHAGQMASAWRCTGAAHQQFMEGCTLFCHPCIHRLSEALEHELEGTFTVFADAHVMRLPWDKNPRVLGCSSFPRAIVYQSVVLSSRYDVSRYVQLDGRPKPLSFSASGRRDGKERGRARFQSDTEVAVPEWMLRLGSPPSLIPNSRSQKSVTRPATTR